MAKFQGQPLKEHNRLCNPNQQGEYIMKKKPNNLVVQKGKNGGGELQIEDKL